MLTPLPLLHSYNKYFLKYKGAEGADKFKAVLDAAKAKM